MDSNTRLIGWLCGKAVHVHHKSLHFKEASIKEFYKSYNTLCTMKRICSLSKQLFMPKGIIEFCGVPYNDNTICEALILTAKYSASDGPNEPNDQGLEIILRIALGLEESRLSSNLTPVEIAMKIAYDQFRLQESPMNAIGRMWHILNDVWNKVPEQKTNPLKAIEEIVGIPYKLVIAFGLALSNCEHGYTFEFTPQEIESMEIAYGIGISAESSKRFLNWISCDIPKYLTCSIPPVYIRYPILNSGIIPNGFISPLYFTPSPNNIISRISTGIYFDLIDKNNMGGGINQFKIEFGYAFEIYVGELLKESLGSFEIFPEIEYGPKKAKKKSVDFFIKKGTTLILVEVKQSSVFADAKFTGKREAIAKSFSTNIVKSIAQLRNTEKDIFNVPELVTFKACSSIIKMVVVADPLYNANSFAKALLLSENNIDAKDIDFINITDLEIILDLQEESQSFFELLLSKHFTDNDMDFNEYILKTYPNKDRNLRFIKKLYNSAILSVDNGTTIDSN